MRVIAVENGVKIPTLATCASGTKQCRTNAHHQDEPLVIEIKEETLLNRCRHESIGLPFGA